MKTRFFLIIFMSLTVMGVSAQIFMSPDERDVVFRGQPSIQSQQIMRPVSSYTGSTYTPFGADTPSDQSEVGSNNGGGRPGQIRRDKVGGPDANQGQQYPIGEPWVLLLFAAGFAGWMAWRKVGETRRLEN